MKREYLSHRGYTHRFKTLADVFNIVSVYYFDEINYSYSIKRWDHTLQYLVENREFSLSDKEKYIEEILKVFSHIHSRGTIHRHFSQNIFIKDNDIKIADFGLEKTFDSECPILQNLRQFGIVKLLSAGS